MPLSNPTYANAASSIPAFMPVTSNAGVVTVVTDAEATAANSTELKAPLGYAGSNCRWVKVGGYASRALFRVKYSGTVTTSPIIQVYGVQTETVPAPAFANDGTIAPTRLDNDAAGSGLTLTLDATNDIRDAAGTPNLYSPWYEYVSPQTGVPGDLLGSTWILVLCSTAANVSGSATIEALLIN